MLQLKRCLVLTPLSEIVVLRNFSSYVAGPLLTSSSFFSLQCVIYKAIYENFTTLWPLGSFDKCGYIMMKAPILKWRCLIHMCWPYLCCTIQRWWLHCLYIVITQLHMYSALNNDKVEHPYFSFWWRDHIAFHCFVKLLMEIRAHAMLICGAYILQAKWHNDVTIHPSGILEDMYFSSSRYIIILLYPENYP